MGSEWLDTRLGEICEILRGSSPRPIVEYLSDIEGMPWVKIADATESDSRFIRKTNQFIRHEGVDRSVIVHKGDLILSNSGTAGLPRFMEITACIHDGWQVLRKLNGITSNYLYYSLIYIRSKLLHNAYDSTMKNLTLDMVRDAIIKLPPLPEQELIAGLLTSIDDKIDLNRQINTTLESMAQALFKSWFVDFDPVIDNALAAGNEIPDELAARAARREALRQQTNKTTNKTTGATGAVSVEQAAPETGLSDQRLPPEIQQLFPDRFVLTEEMGWVPEGWEVGVLEDLLVLQRGFDLPKSSRTDGVYPLMAASGQDGTHNESKVPGPGITTGRSGKLGEVCFVERDFWPLNTTLWVKEFRRSSPYHAFYLLKSMDLEKYNSGSAVPTLNRNYVHNVSALLPSKNVIAAYDKFVSGCYSKKYANDEQIESLANLRDSLLPKLLSGQITIPDAEQQLAEVL